jgi:hypothetical protein
MLLTVDQQAGSFVHTLSALLYSPQGVLCDVKSAYLWYSSSDSSAGGAFCSRKFVPVRFVCVCASFRMEVVSVFAPSALDGTCVASSSAEGPACRCAAPSVEYLRSRKIIPVMYVCVSASFAAGFVSEVTSSAVDGTCVATSSAAD